MSFAPTYYGESDGEGSYLMGGAVLRDSVHLRRKQRFSTCGSFQIFFYPALGGLLFGYDIGATSAVILQLQSHEYSGVLWHTTVNENSLLQGVITSASMLGAMIGCIICLRFADTIGRRKTLLFAAVFYILGAVVEGVSGYPTWTTVDGLSVLLTGRVIYGLGIGLAMQGAPTYIGEMAPASIRGLLVSMKEVFVVLGMLLGYSVGYGYSETSGGWRLTYAWSTIIAMMMFSGVFYLPNSAPWLAMRGCFKEALEAKRFVTPRLSQGQVRRLHELGESASFVYNEQCNHNSLCDLWRQLSSSSVRNALLAGVGLVVFQQISGQPSVLFYTDTLLADIGINTAASVPIAIFKLFATLVATFTVDRHGRKRLLYIGCTTMFVSLISLAIALSHPYISASRCNEHITMQSCPDACTWDDSSNQCALLYACPTHDPCDCCTAKPIDFQKSVILVSLFTYIGGYQIGFGPIVWLLISELFPLKVRGRAVALAVVTNFFLGTVVALLYPLEIQYLGATATFSLFATVLACCLAFVYVFVPETKGMSLQEIEQFFAQNSHTEEQVVSVA